MLVEIDLLPHRDKIVEAVDTVSTNGAVFAGQLIHRDAEGVQIRMTKADGSGWIETDGTFVSDDEMERNLLDARHSAQDDPEAALRMLASFYKETERWEDYGQYLEELVRLSEDEEETSRLLLTLGGESEGRKDWKAAARYYLRCVATNPTEPDVGYLSRNNLAYCLIQLGKWSPAESYCRSAIRMDPGRHNAHKNLGLALRGRGFLIESAQAFLVAVEQAPKDRRALAHLHEMIQARPGAFVSSPDLLDRIRGQ